MEEESQKRHVECTRIAVSEKNFAIHSHKRTCISHCDTTKMICRNRTRNNNKKTNQRANNDARKKTNENTLMWNDGWRAALFLFCCWCVWYLWKVSCVFFYLVLGFLNIFWVCFSPFFTSFFVDVVVLLLVLSIEHLFCVHQNCPSLRRTKPSSKWVLQLWLLQYSQRTRLSSIARLTNHNYNEMWWKTKFNSMQRLGMARCSIVALFCSCSYFCRRSHAHFRYKNEQNAFCSWQAECALDSTGIRDALCCNCQRIDAGITALMSRDTAAPANKNENRTARKIRSLALSGCIGMLTDWGPGDDERVPRRSVARRSLACQHTHMQLATCTAQHTHTTFLSLRDCIL